MQAVRRKLFRPQSGVPSSFTVPRLPSYSVRRTPS